MESLIEQAWDDYRADKFIDPAKRYIHDDHDIFVAGWRAAQANKRRVVARESIWVQAPTLPDEDPE